MEAETLSDMSKVTEMGVGDREGIRIQDFLIPNLLLNTSLTHTHTLLRLIIMIG